VQLSKQSIKTYTEQVGETEVAQQVRAEVECIVATICRKGERAEEFYSDAQVVKPCQLPVVSFGTPASFPAA
jgi:hypothetical protein